MEVKDEKYIVLYADEFNLETWENYCAALGIDSEVDWVKIIVKGVEI